MKEKENPILTEEAVKVIEKALSQRKKVEIGVKNGKIAVWEISSKTRYEKAIT